VSRKTRRRKGRRQSAAVFKFRIGDVFPADNPLSLWAANLSMAFNDLVFTNDRMDKARKEWERFYWSRPAWAHLYEVMQFLRENENDQNVTAFVAELSPDAQEAYRRALELYVENRAILGKVRNNVAFHYPHKRGLRMLRATLIAAAEGEGQHGSQTGKIRDARLTFADDFQAHMVVKACGGRIEDYEEKAASIGELTAALMKFLNHGLDHYFVTREAAT